MDEPTDFDFETMSLNMNEITTGTNSPNGDGHIFGDLDDPGAVNGDPGNAHGDSITSGMKHPSESLSDEINVSENIDLDMKDEEDMPLDLGDDPMIETPAITDPGFDAGNPNPNPDDDAMLNNSLLDSISVDNMVDSMDIPLSEPQHQHEPEQTKTPSPDKPEPQLDHLSADKTQPEPHHRVAGKTPFAPSESESQTSQNASDLTASNASNASTESATNAQTDHTDHTEQNASNATTAATENASNATNQDRVVPDNAARPDRIPQTHTIVIPSYSSWFCMTRISEVERESLPEFFGSRNRSKTPQVYVKYRNFMVNAYRMNPDEYLTVTACRRNLVGDASTIMRVHHFLDEWGLINYQVGIEARPASVAPPFTGHWRVKYDTPRGLFPFQIYEGANDPNLQPVRPGEKYASKPNKPAEPENAEKAEKAKHEPANGEPPLAKPVPELDADGWTREDVLKMLEAVEKHPHDWDAVASILNRDKADIVRKFVQQTVEDGFAEEDAGPLKYNANHIPFSRSENPVLSVLAFLTSTLDSELLEAALGRTRKLVQTRIDSAQKPAKTDGDDMEVDKPESKPESDALNTHDNDKPTPDPTASNPDLKPGSAEAAVMALSAVRGHAFMNNTERYMYDTFIQLIDAELRTIKLRLSKFAMLERTLDIERGEMDREREFIFLDRMHFRRNVDEALSLVDQAAAAATEGDGEKLKSIAAQLRERAQPEPPLRPVFNPAKPPPGAEAESVDEVPPTAQTGRPKRLWTLEPRK